MIRRLSLVGAVTWAMLCVFAVVPVRSEVILQYFQMPWRSLTQKMPELAEAGYSAMWLPPPTKASGGLSVGYDLWDPFDLGSKDQRNTVRTFYGTEDELLEMVRTAHRFGIRVYFDNVMNHRAFDIPGFNETTPLDIYPGMLPEDFHVRVTEDGFYRKWDNTRDWNDEWQVQHLGLSDLIDIAHEVGAGGWNHNHGPFEGAHHPGISFVRHPDNPEYYAYDPTGTYVGYGNVTQAMLDNNPVSYTEDVNAYLIRGVRWLMDRTKADGLRLDAVKHVPAFFFGQQQGANKDESTDGYVGGMQLQFKLSRGFEDNNLRDTVFNHELPRNDAMVFGEHLGSPPAFEPYIDAGMRLKDAPLRDSLNGLLGQGFGSLAGMDQPGHSGHPAFNQFTGVQFAHSHDSDYASARGLQYAYYMTRAGLPIVYTDGYFKAGTLQDAGGAFPRHANTAFLGQFGDQRLPNLAYIHEHFARGEQRPHWADNDVVAYSRVDKREEGWGVKDMPDGDGIVLLFMMNDNFADGQARSITSAFAHTPGGPDTYLHNYSTYGGGFYVWASDIAATNVIVPPGGYFAFSWRTPEGSSLWGDIGGRALRIYENGQEPDSVRYTRRDGPDGDEQFNPLGLPNRGYPAGTTPEPFRYQVEVPRITSGTNLSFVARIDGSAINVLMKLNGGVDVNAPMGLGNQSDPGNRDRAPGHVTDTFLGWEDTEYVKRIWPEKFASVNSESNTIGSLGATSYETVMGSGTQTVIEADADNDFSEFNNVLSWVYHEPSAEGDGALAGTDQFRISGSDLIVNAKTPKRPGIRPFIYYTVDGVTWPEGAAGFGGNPATRVVEGTWVGDGTPAGETDWWEFVLPAPTNGTTLRHKIGASREQGHDGNDFDVAFPNHPDDVARKYNMLGVWQITNFNAETVAYYPHNDWSTMTTGLVEGLNFLQARAFLEREARAPLYNTFKQTFYLDLERPSGEIKFPAANDTLFSQEFGVVVRTDPTVTEVRYNVLDSDAVNDGETNGNGTNELGQAYWASATEVTANPSVDSEYPREWRFTYRNIPDSGNATIRVMLRELSSSTNVHLTEEAGHYTILEQSVTTEAPSTRFFFNWPTEDGQVVEEGWTVRVHFEESLGFGLNDEELRDRFLIKINGAPQPKTDYAITRSIGDGLGSIEYDLPLLFNGDAEFLHLIEFTHVTGDDITLQTTRFVKAAPAVVPPFLSIVDPVQVDSNGQQTEIVLPDIPDPDPADRSYAIVVHADSEIEHVWIEFANEAGSAQLTDGPVTNDTIVMRTFTWSNMTAGTFTFTAYGSDDPAGTNVVNSVLRTIPVRLRQLVENDGSGDADNDGLRDNSETTQEPLPEVNSDQWQNGDVHIWRITGRTDPLMPITDGGGLPDGLQVGLIGPLDTNATDRAADTNGDGYKNFIPDLDPPLFNTFDNNWHADFREFAGRTDQITGSMTDPSRADTDGDGLMEKQEDLNRNGRVDIGLLGLAGKVESILTHPDIPTDYNSSRVARDRLPANAIFLETDINRDDTIGDGLQDGQSDASRSGRVDMYLLFENDTQIPLDYTDWNGDFFQFNRMPNDPTIIYWDDENPPSWHAPGTDYAPIISRAVDYAALTNAFNRNGDGTMQTNGWPKILITETDPLVVDTVGDGLPDGWKDQFGLDPLDDGVYNWRTGEPGDPVNGPDGDLTEDGFTNMDHFLNGSDPRQPVTPVPPPEGTIVLGADEALGEVAGVQRFREFIDWDWDDLRALDAYEGGGGNHQGGDIYPAFDEWDSSRDMVAFYSRDGGALPEGTGEVYFRVDFHDLKLFAEQGEMDLYVVINFGDTIGERVLPDEVDTLTDMRWRAVVAVYESSLGQVYVDMDSMNNTDVFGQDLFVDGGVVLRPEYFLGAYFSRRLDAVEFAIDRQALTEAGWSGANPADLRFQVYTTKSGTGNNPVGSGDIGGRSDIRDSFFNDFIAENHHAAQANLQGDGSVLTQWIPGDNRPGRVKVATVIHGNEQIRPGSFIQDRLQNSGGAGYYRPLDVHEVFGLPLNLHITPLLASAIQWAKAAPGTTLPWRDGPAFNERLTQLMQGGVISPFATTFSDHILSYFPTAYSQDSIAMAHDWLETIYDYDMSQQQILYPPERALDADALATIAALGYDYTLVDQMMHLRHWLGRETALGRDGFRINRIRNVNTFAINDRVSSFRFDAHDHGAPMALRRQLNNMARSGTQDQVLILHSSWDDFLNSDNAEAYDDLMIWLANRAWTKPVALEDIVNAEVDLTGDGNGNAWFEIDRGSPATPSMAADWIQYATGGDYDNWYFGSPIRAGLEPTVFEERPGSSVSADFGQVAVDGIADQAWGAATTVSNVYLGNLARGVSHAATFVTAFHNQEDVDLSKFSTGDYVFPDTEFRGLAAFSRYAASQMRHAALYTRVDQWVDEAASITNTHRVAEDIDLDGELEHVLYNNRVFAVLERSGGRMTAAWVRHPDSGRLFQTIGNFVGHSASDTELEGAFSVETDGSVEAHRTTALKDWWAGTSDYVNQIYTFTDWTNGWRITSTDGQIVKTVTLADTSNWFEVFYQVNPGLNDGVLFVRHGLSPDLWGLLVHGQDRLSEEIHDQGVMSLIQTHPDDVAVAANLAYQGGVYDTLFNTGASDTNSTSGAEFTTVSMRNQAQTHQVEVFGTNAFTFALGFEVLEDLGEQFNDGVPFSWLLDAGFNPDTVDVNTVMASNQVYTLRQAYIADIDPHDPNAFFRVGSAAIDSGGGGLLVRWLSATNRIYHLYRSTNLLEGSSGFLLRQGAIPADPPENEYLDTDVDLGNQFFYRIEADLPAPP